MSWNIVGGKPSSMAWVTRATLVTEVGPVGLIWVIMPCPSFICRACAFSTPANGTNQSLYPVWFTANVAFLTILFVIFLHIFRFFVGMWTFPVCITARASEESISSEWHVVLLTRVCLFRPPTFKANSTRLIV